VVPRRPGSSISTASPSPSSGDDRTLEQIKRHLSKLIDVEEVSIVSQKPFVERQVALVKVRGTPGSGRHDRGSQALRRPGCGHGPSAITYEITSDESRIDAFIKGMEPYGVLEVSGRAKCPVQGRRACFKREFSNAATGE